MSFGLYVFDCDVPDDESTIIEWIEDDSCWDTALTQRLTAFVAELEHRYPGCDQIDDSPWSSWPLTNAMVDGHCCGFGIRWSQAERMSAELRAICAERGLTIYDPQEGQAIYPNTWPSQRH